MSKAIKAASSLGAVALVLSGAVMAAPPSFGFDKWSVTGGTIAIGDLDTGSAGVQTCPSGWTCSTPITGDGFFQRQMSDGTNDYFQTIITDKGVTGAPGAVSFSDESYVRSGNQSGLADKSSIGETTTTAGVVESFRASTELLTGWANNGNGDEVKIYQGIGALDGTATTGGEDFRTDFWLAQLGNQGANGKLMRITSAVDIQESAGSSQDFVLVDRRGNAYVNASAANEVDFDNNAGTTGDNLSWAQGDNVKAIWIGQDMSQVAEVFQEFGFTAYENLTTPKVVSSFSLAPNSSTSGPIDWTTTAPPVGWGGLATDGTGGPF